MTDHNQDQESLWQTFLNIISGQIGGVEAQKVMAAGGRVDCDLGNEEEVIALSVAYDIGNTIPNWGLKWSGAFNQKLFDTYKQWVQNLIPQGGASETGKQKELDTEIDDLRKKLASYDDDIASITQQIRKEWLEEVCAQTDTSGLQCKSYFTAPPDPTWTSYLQDYRKGDNYQAKVQHLETVYGKGIDALATDLSKKMIERYGANYQELAQAQEAVALGDPKVPHKPDELNQVSQYQMKVKEDDTVVSVPRFKTSELKDFRDWLRQQQSLVSQNNGPLFAEKAQVQIHVSSQQITHKDSSWQFRANGGIPIDWFWLGASTSDSHREQYDEVYSFDALITYQAITTVNIEPGAWFLEGLLSTYSDYNNWPTGSPFIGKTMWGPVGIMNVIVKGVIIGFAPFLRITSSDWSKMTSQTNWSAKATFGIGPFNFESASTSGQGYSSFTQNIVNGIEVRDTSGTPKIIGLIVDTPNSSSAA